MNLTDIPARIRVLHPTIKDGEFELVDLGAGAGPEFAAWSFGGAAEPTEAELAAVDPADYVPPLTLATKVEALLDADAGDRTELDALLTRTGRR